MTTSSSDDEGTLYFFRKRPPDGTSLISSLQSVESSFFLVALGRYPHALTTLVAGLESALKYADIGAKRGDTLQTLIHAARSKSVGLCRVSETDLNELRLARNRFAHRGFSPKDDSDAVELYLRVAVPAGNAIYSELHGFDFRDSLLQEYLELLDVAAAVAERAKTAGIMDKSYCLNAFSHLLRWKFQENFSTGWQLAALEYSDDVGLRFDRVSKGKDELERQFAASCILNCPICDAIADAVCELDSHALDAGQLVPRRFACMNCGFVIRQSESFLSEVLLESQLTESRKTILAEYGI